MYLLSKMVIFLWHTAVQVIKHTPWNTDLLGGHQVVVKIPIFGTSKAYVIHRFSWLLGGETSQAIMKKHIPSRKKWIAPENWWLNLLGHIWVIGPSSFYYIWRNKLLKTNNVLAILFDLFGMVNWPFQRLSDPSIGDKKVEFLNFGPTKKALKRR